MTTTEAYAVDTHTLLWYLSGSTRLSNRVRAILDQADDRQMTLIVPVIVLAEALTLIEKRKVALTLDELLSAVRDTSRFMLVPLDMPTFEAMLALDGLELHDRAIAATCKLFGCPLLSRDEQLANEIATIW